jgi:hypothetical protein
MNIIPDEIVSELSTISLKNDTEFELITNILFGFDQNQKPDVNSKEYSEFVQLLERFSIDTFSPRCYFSKKLSLVTKRDDLVVLGYIIQLEIGGSQGDKLPKWFATWFSSSLDESLNYYHNPQNLPSVFNSVLNAWRGKKNKYQK